jgi:hypothetical protein
MIQAKSPVATGQQTFHNHPDGLWVVALAVLAAVLRLWHINHGLPDFDEEAFAFRKALELWGPAGQRGDLNPHWFVYPSLTIYLHFALQRVHYILGGFSRPADYLLSFLIDPSRAVVLARTLVVVADVATVVLVGRIARRFGSISAIVAMTIVACAPFMIRTSRQIYSDPIMCALCIAAIDRMLSYTTHGGRHRLAMAGIAIGFAAGAKYPGILLIGPLGVAIWHRERRWARLGAWATACASTLTAFLITTPYLLASWSEFVRDAVFIGDITSAGGLGNVSGRGLPYYVGGLGQNLGWLGLGLLGVALVGAVRPSRTRTLAVLAACWLVFFLPIAWVWVEAERYLVPVIAASAILVGAAAARVLGAIPKAGSAGARISLAGLILAQVLWSGVWAGTSGRSTTQLEARRWCEAHLGARDLLLSEAYGPDLLTYDRLAQVRSDQLFEAASAALQKKYLAQQAFHMVWLPLVVSGHMGVRLPSADAPELLVYPHAVDWNAAVYDIRLLAGVDYVATTAAVRGRFEMDSLRFREQHRFYAFLDRIGEEVGEFTSGRGVDGSRITIYRLRLPAWQAILGAGVLDSLWWARTVPEGFKQRVTLLLGASGGQVDSTRGLPAWAQALRPVYAERYGVFADELAENLAQLDRLEYAKRLSCATLRMVPEDAWAAQVYLQAAGGLGQWKDVRREIETSIAAVRRHGEVPPNLLLLQAEALRMTGDQQQAQAILLNVLRSGNEEAAAAALERLRRLARPVQ